MRNMKNEWEEIRMEKRLRKRKTWKGDKQGKKKRIKNKI